MRRYKASKIVTKRLQSGTLCLRGLNQEYQFRRLSNKRLMRIDHRWYVEKGLVESCSLPLKHEGEYFAEKDHEIPWLNFSFFPVKSCCSINNLSKALNNSENCWVCWQRFSVTRHHFSQLLVFILSKFFLSFRDNSPYLVTSRSYFFRQSLVVFQAFVSTCKTIYFKSRSSVVVSFPA